jgi:hypothetical protein
MELRVFIVSMINSSRSVMVGKCKKLCFLLREKSNEDYIELEFKNDNGFMQFWARCADWAVVASDYYT